MEAGGIMPDSIVVEDTLTGFASELVRKSMFFRFAVQYATTHKVTNKEFNDDLLKDFRRYLKDKNFDYKDEAEKKMEELSKISSKKNFSSSFENHLNEMEKQLKIEKEKEFDRNINEIKENLENELVGNIFGQTEQIAYSLKNDHQVLTAIKILENKKIYSKILKIK
jgi:carboxyl-terminal processing protease